ncbi:oligosaccharide flippase family protein [Bacillus sp. V3]|nr:oligosaccharide flippase family protein [Bacillus sp. V3]
MIYNYVFKIGYMVINFLYVPIMLKILGENRFGIWQTMLTMISWAALANFGIGNGLRNKISESLAENKKEIIKKYISSAYAFLLFISIVIFLITVLIIINLDMDTIFKGKMVSDKEIVISFILIAANFSINFFIGLVNSIAYGIHKSYLVSFYQFGMSLIIYIFLIAFYKFDIAPANISFMALIFLVSTTISNVFFSYRIFKQWYLRPSLRKVDMDTGKQLITIGFKFFILQISTMFLFSIDNFLISYLLGAEEVTNYSIVSKLFMTVNTMFSILLIQLWNSTTDAYTKKEYRWIKNAITKILFVFLLAVVGIILIYFLFDKIILIWLGTEISVDKNLVFFVGIYIVLLMWNGIFVNVENGTGHINYQIIAYIIAAVINVPLSIILVNYFNYGLIGIVIAKIICILIPSIVCSIHVYFLLREKFR